jgi:hypothetical protein
MMAVTTSVSKRPGAKSTPAEGAIVAALRRLPPDYLAEVLRYIEFLQYKLEVTHGDAVEEAALWAAVAANKEYKRLRPDEDLEVYETGADFLEAVVDL